MSVIVTLSYGQISSDPFSTRKIDRSPYKLTQVELEQDPYEGCTIGVAAGSATSDGRPLVWKTRDSNAHDNEVVYNTMHAYKFVAVINANVLDYSWMGVNNKGFAILNSYSPDLPGGSTGYGNGSIMRYALGTCATVADFEELLTTTNQTGRTTQANFGVIDATGAAAIYETSGTQYWKYDANNIAQAPNGYVLRTNFALNGGGSGGIERYNRTQKLIGDFHAGNTLSLKSILRTQMRDFSDYSSDPISIPFLSQWAANIPYGYIDTGVSICRATSVSTAVIHGVLPGESSLLSTMWTILGQPATTIAVPYWPVGSTPSAANGSVTAPLCDMANEIWYQLFDWSDFWYIDTHKLRDEYGGGIWCQTFAAEDSIFALTDSMLTVWRSDTISVSQMLSVETECANYALDITTDCYNMLVSDMASDLAILSPAKFGLSQNYPNPFNPTTCINYELPITNYVELAIYNLIGQRIATLVAERQSDGYHMVEWDASGYASGIYYYQLKTGEFENVKKMILLK